MSNERLLKEILSLREKVEKVEEENEELRKKYQVPAEEEEAKEEKKKKMMEEKLAKLKEAQEKAKEAEEKEKREKAEKAKSGSNEEVGKEVEEKAREQVELPEKMDQNNCKKMVSGTRSRSDHSEGNCVNLLGDDELLEEEEEDQKQGDGQSLMEREKLEMKRKRQGTKETEEEAAGEAKKPKPDLPEEAHHLLDKLLIWKCKALEQIEANDKATDAINKFGPWLSGRDPPPEEPAKPGRNREAVNQLFSTGGGPVGGAPNANHGGSYYQHDKRGMSGLICWNCKNPGHRARDCRAPRQKLAGIEFTPQNSSEAQFQNNPPLNLRQNPAEVNRLAGWTLGSGEASSTAGPSSATDTTDNTTGNQDCYARGTNRAWRDHCNRQTPPGR